MKKFGLLAFVGLFLSSFTTLGQNRTFIGVRGAVNYDMYEFSKQDAF
jgi:hypothetical protein